MRTEQSEEDSLIMKYSGNIVTPQKAGFGTIFWNGDTIEKISLTAPADPDSSWIVPGFIDTHLHGLAEGGLDYDGIVRMAEFCPATGVTALTPTLDSVMPDETVAFLENVRDIMQSHPCGKRILGSHLEGPFLAPEYAGGMLPEALRLPDLPEVKRFLEAAGNTLLLVTLAPELPGALEVIRYLKKCGVAVSAGHTAMKTADIGKIAAAGVDRICHLYDTFQGREVCNGVPIPSLVDVVTVDDRFMLELILDGFHVPPELVKLAIRAAGSRRIIGITDALTGTGLPDGEYIDSTDRIYTLDNNELCRLKDDPDIIVGSCLTMNRAFFNLVNLFDRSPVEASEILSANPARYAGLGDVTGQLLPGLRSDITILAPDMRKVEKCFVAGEECFGV